jgi:copper resistance protein B
MPHPKFALLAAAASLVVAAPAAAQHQGHMPGMPMPGMKMPPPAKKKPAAKKPAAKKKGAAKKPAAKKPSGKKPAAKKRAAKPAAQPHADHDMSQMPGMEMPPGQPGTTGETMPGHDMSQMPGMTMPPGHEMPGMEAPAGTDLPAGNAPAPPVPTDNAADAVYGAEAMNMGRHHLQTFHGGQKMFQLFNNVMEYQARKGRDGYEWDSEAWYGGDINRLWLKSEGDGAFGKPLERAEVQALSSRAIDPYFNIQGGVRYDFKPNPSRVYATIGIEGLAPSFFEVEGALFLSNKGELMARAEGYYDQRITQRLILQPRAELNFAAQNSREIGIGSGLSDAEIGLRLRYDIRREFAPYVGVQHQRAFGTTRRYLRDAGENAGGWEFVVGVRTWF